MRPWLPARVLSLWFCAGFVPWLAHASRSDPEDLQARFEHESNSVHKAKLFEKLGDEQLAETRRASRASDFVTVGQVMEKYRDNARAALDALKKEHPNAEHQLSGYKQLQIHIRKALRDLKEMLLLAPPEVKPPLELVEHDLASIDDELLRMLFPPRPGKKNPRAGSRRFDVRGLRQLQAIAHRTSPRRKPRTNPKPNRNPSLEIRPPDLQQNIQRRKRK